MLNVAFAGNIYNESGTQYTSTEVKYQALFYRSLDGWTKWNDVHVSELGQYNCNLGDGDFLSQSGNNSPGDKVIICFWTDNTKDRNAVDLTEWSFIEIALDGSDTYINDVQTMDWQSPLCNFTTNGNIILDNLGTSNDYNWLFGGLDHYQELERYGEELFHLMSFDDDCVNIDWGDFNIDIEDLEDEYPYTYGLSGDYHITVQVYNRGGLYCQSEFDVSSTFNIVNGLDWTNPVYKGISSTYTPSISGDTFQIIEVDYFINGIIEYTGLDYDESFNHTFNGDGPHTIKQRILYDNISGNEYQEQDFTVFLGSIANFYKEDGVCGPRFVDSSNIGNGPATNHYWGIKFDGDIIAEVNSVDLIEWEYNWPYEGTFTVIHKVKDNFGNEFGLERIYNVEKCNDGSGTGTGDMVGGGGGGGWVQTQYIEIEFPKLKVEKIEEIDETKLNISIKTTLI